MKSPLLIGLHDLLCGDHSDDNEARGGGEGGGGGGGWDSERVERGERVLRKGLMRLIEIKKYNDCRKSYRVIL